MAQYTQANGNDALAMLFADHRHVRALFQHYADTPDPYLKQIIAEHVFAELTLHLVLEETVLYPALAEQADAAGKRRVSDALQGHQQLRGLMDTLHVIDDDALFARSFHALQEQVEQHVAAAETGLFPLAQQVLATHLAEIASLLQERKAQILGS
jgi:iron-sulfur cluster repair protein YtfE (RIC family)